MEWQSRKLLILGNTDLFANFLFTVSVALYLPPFPTSKVMDFLLNFS